MEEREIFLGDLKINYKIAGQGPAILILHGWGGSSDSWVEVSHLLAKNGFRIIFPDLPGFGKSLTPYSPWGLEDYSNFILKFTQKLNLEKFFLLGHSFGGRVAIKFAYLHPEKIKCLILCDSAGIKIKPSFKSKIILLIAKIGNAIFGLNHLKRFKDQMRNLFYLFLRNKDYVRASETMKKTMKKILKEDLSREIKEIKLRTLILWGENDKMVPLKYAYFFKENIKDSRLIIFPKVGHSPHLEVPQELAKEIYQFLKQC